MTNALDSWFRFLGGSLCLDFVNTVGARVPGSEPGEGTQRFEVAREWLHGYEDLMAWARQASVVDARQAERLLERARREPESAASAFERAWALREALYRLFAALPDGTPEEADLALLNREVAAARAQQRLRPAARGLEWTWDEADVGSLDQLVWRVVLSASELLTSGDLTRVRRCAGEECGWIFLDTTRNRTRRWCDMGDCGNAAKVRRFRERQRRAARGENPS